MPADIAEGIRHDYPRTKYTETLILIAGVEVLFF